MIVNCGDVELDRMPYLLVEAPFETYPKIQHIGFTTWSGNQGMMRLGEKSGLKLEGQIRKVRYWQETWYDSIKYGILREELKNK